MTPNGPNLGEYEGMFPLILQPILGKVGIFSIVWASSKSM
jgi:hypothetical protein